MPLFGITGGIATGKSTLTRLLARRLPAEVFDADQMAHRLLATDPSVRSDVTKVFGQRIYDSGGLPDRRLLRDLVFADAELRRRLEEILHPPIQAQWQALAESQQPSHDWLLVDLPLLFETGAESHFDRVVVTACSPETQTRRLLTERGLDSEIAAKIISAQLDLSIKIRKADHVVWSDSSLSSLERQSELLATLLAHCYG